MNMAKSLLLPIKKKSSTEFAKNSPVELDSDRNHSRTWAIRPRWPDSTSGKHQMCTCRARKRCHNLTSTMKHGVPTTWTTTTQSHGMAWPKHEESKELATIHVSRKKKAACLNHGLKVCLSPSLYLSYSPFLGFCLSLLLPFSPLWHDMT